MDCDECCRHERLIPRQTANVGTSAGQFQNQPGRHGRYDDLTLILEPIEQTIAISTKD